MSSPLTPYADSMREARQQIEDLPELRAIVGPQSTAELMHGFLIEWAARSTQLHESVERVLVLGSRRCASLGELEVGRNLMGVASEAIERYRRAAADTRMLVQLWNHQREPQLQLTGLLMRAKSAAVLQLQAHDEALIASAQPWTQLAAIYEVEALLAQVVEPVRGRAQQLLGDEVLACLSSLQVLVVEEPGSRLGQAMQALLERKPESAAALAEAGRARLERYASFLLECHAAALDRGTPQASRRAFV